MAEHTSSGSAELGAPMDYPEHERTYDGFVSLTKITVLATVITMVALAIFSFGGSWGFWLGTLLLILMMIATVIGIVAKGTLRPLIAVAVLGVVLMALSVS
jgi:hypothetical protein